MGSRFETAFVASVTHFGRGFESQLPQPMLAREPSCKSSLAPGHVLARSNQNDGSGIMPLPHLGYRSAAASERYDQTWCVGGDVDCYSFIAVAGSSAGCQPLFRGQHNAESLGRRSPASDLTTRGAPREWRFRRLLAAAGDEQVSKSDGNDARSRGRLSASEAHGWALGAAKHDGEA
jgi:hypothetical protein